MGGAVPTTQQTLITGTYLVYAECEAAIRDVAALAADQTSLAHLFAVVSSTAHGRPAVLVNFTSGTWKTKAGVIFWGHFLNKWTEGNGRSLAFLSIGNAAVALPKHAAESADALGVPPTVVALPSHGNAKTKVSITGEAPPTGPVVFAHSLRRWRGKC